jgi:tetratricopeptide (TPR) repeat protein
LAIAFWSSGFVDRAIGFLDEAVDRLTLSLGREHPMRVDALSTLGEMMFQQGHAEEAGVIHREVLECRLRQAGADHPDSLAAKGDLATILRVLGQEDEAERLEREALESAQKHLGKAHPVTCVLAWNRVLSYERRGDLDSARELITAELAWLLPEDPSGLERDQNTIRALLAKRLN